MLASNPFSHDTSSYACIASDNQTENVDDLLFYVLYQSAADDMRFAMTRGIKPPHYATAGDCYSRLGCPQVSRNQTIPFALFDYEDNITTV